MPYNIGHIVPYNRYKLLNFFFIVYRATTLNKKAILNFNMSDTNAEKETRGTGFIFQQTRRYSLKKILQYFNFKLHCYCAEKLKRYDRVSR